MPGKILIVDDDANTCDTLSRMLSRWGYEALTADSRDQAVTILRETVPQVILLDVLMPGCPILPFLQACSAVNPKPKVALISAYPEEFEQWRAQVAECVPKPIEPTVLKRLVESLLAA